MSEVVKKIKPFVTTFSPQFNHVEKHGNVETIGGKIVRVLRASDILEEVPDDEMSSGVYLTVDDDIGEMSIYLPRSVSETFENKNGELTLGTLVLAQGRVHVLNTVHESIMNNGNKSIIHISPNETIRLLAYTLIPIS